MKKKYESTTTRRFGRETDVEALTGIKRATLAYDRAVGRSRFPFYKVGSTVLYDLDEVQRIILATRQGGTA